MTTAPTADGDRECKVSPDTLSFLQTFLIKDVTFVQVLFDTSKKELLNPNQGFKKFVMKLKQRYDVSFL